MIEGLLAWTGGLLLTAVAAELFARVWLSRGGYFPFVPHMRQRFQVDTEVLPTLEANTQLAINSRGERGSEPPSDKAEAFRILVAGGSGAECYLLDQERAWPAVLERALGTRPRLKSAKCSQVHVGNISRSLLTCASQAKVLEKFLPSYGKLDLMLTFVGAADVVSWLEEGMPAEVADENLPVDFLFQQNPETRYGWSLGNCALRRLGIQVTRRLFHPEEQREQVGRSIARNRKMRAAASHWIDSAPDSSAMAACFERNLRRMIRAGQEHDAAVIIVRQPWLERDFSPEEELQLWNFGRGRPLERELDTYYTLPLVHSLLRTLDQVQARVAQDLGIPQLDMMDVVPRDFEHFYDSFHFTPKGAEWMGKYLAEQIPRSLKWT